MDQQSAIVVSAAVVCASQQEALHTVEVLSRAATGLAFEGQSINITMITVDEDDQ